MIRSDLFVPCLRLRSLSVSIFSSVAYLLTIYFSRNFFITAKEKNVLTRWSEVINCFLNFKLIHESKKTVDVNSFDEAKRNRDNRSCIFCCRISQQRFNKHDNVYRRPKFRRFFSLSCNGIFCSASSKNLLELVRTKCVAWNEDCGCGALKNRKESEEFDSAFFKLSSWASASRSIWCDAINRLLVTVIMVKMMMNHRFSMTGRCKLFGCLEKGSLVKVTTTSLQSTSNRLIQLGVQLSSFSVLVSETLYQRMSRSCGFDQLSYLSLVRKTSLTLWQIQLLQHHVTQIEKHWKIRRQDEIIASFDIKSVLCFRKKKTSNY